jgi:anion-transporting  ArsA/GET3 family ATPase
VDVRESLMEYLQKFYKLGRAGSVLEKVGAVDFATTIAPGLRDVLLIGKVYEAAGRRGSIRQHDRPVYDTVVLDAPPTGRVVRFLNVNAEVADVARVGPIRTQADSITRMLRSHRTAVHVVSLLEEMPVQETVDALAELKKASLPVGAVIINQVHEQALDGGDLETVAADPDGLGAAVTADLKSVSVRTSAAMVTGLLAEGTEHADRVALQQEQEAILTGLGRQVYRLPLLPEGTEAGGIRVLADALTEQGMI